MSPCTDDVGFALVLVAIGVMVALIKVGHGVKVYYLAKAAALGNRSRAAASTHTSETEDA